MSRYRAFGLCIEVKWPCPLLSVSTSEKVDVEASLGTIHTPLAEEQDPSWYKANERQLLLTIPSVARFLVEEGKSIIIEPLCDDLDYINVFLLGSAMSGLLHQRGLLVLHANAISLGDEALIVAAPIGGGKSTLAGAFIKSGYSLLADDVCAIQSFDDGSPPIVYPSYPQIKLCKNVLSLLGYNHAKLKAVGHKTDKYYVPIHDNFCTHALPIQRVLIMARHEEETHSWKTILGKDKLKHLLEHTYRYSFLTKQELLSKHFEVAASLMESVPWFHLNRSSLGFSAFDLVEEITSKKAESFFSHSESFEV